MKSEQFEIKLPLLGFEEVTQAEFAEVDDGALGFLSLKQREVDLLLINPYKVREYSFEVPTPIQLLLELKENSQVKVFCIFVKTAEDEIKINFLAPVILNYDNHTLAQVALSSKDYPHFGIAESIKNYIKE